MKNYAVEEIEFDLGGKRYQCKGLISNVEEHDARRSFKGEHMNGEMGTGWTIRLKASMMSDLLAPLLDAYDGRVMVNVTIKRDSGHWIDLPFVVEWFTLTGAAPDGSMPKSPVHLFGLWLVRDSYKMRNLYRVPYPSLRAPVNRACEMKPEPEPVLNTLPMVHEMHSGKLSSQLVGGSVVIRANSGAIHSEMILDVDTAAKLRDDLTNLIKMRQP